MQLRRLYLTLITGLFLLSSRSFAKVSLPMQFRDGMIWVKVSVPGRNESLNFLLDSGAGASVIDLASAHRLGLQLGAPCTVQGVHGRGNAFQVNGFDAQTGGAQIPSSLLALDLSAPSAGLHQRIDGLLGADFFRGRIIRIDFGAQTLCLLDRSEVNSSGGVILPLVKRNDALCMHISVDGNKPELLRLDTGCNRALEWVMDGGKAKKMGVSDSIREIRTAVNLGAAHVASVKTGIHPRQLFAGESGLIGNGLLSRFTVTLDASEQWCMLTSR